MHSDELTDYLEFEIEFTQDETERFKSSGSEEDRMSCLHKRLEAKQAWEKMGKVVPPRITFSDNPWVQVEKSDLLDALIEGVNE